MKGPATFKEPVETEICAWCLRGVRSAVMDNVFGLFSDRCGPPVDERQGLDHGGGLTRILVSALTS